MSSTIRLAPSDPYPRDALDPDRGLDSSLRDHLPVGYPLSNHALDAHRGLDLSQTTDAFARQLAARSALDRARAVVVVAVRDKLHVLDRAASVRIDVIEEQLDLLLRDQPWRMGGGAIFPKGTPCFSMTLRWNPRGQGERD